MTWTFPMLTAQAVSFLVGTVFTVNAHTTCLPVDNTAKGICAHLMMYATATKDPYKAVRDSVKIPPITTAEVPTQLVPVTTDAPRPESIPACNYLSTKITRLLES